MRARSRMPASSRPWATSPSASPIVWGAAPPSRRLSSRTDLYARRPAMLGSWARRGSRFMLRILAGVLVVGLSIGAAAADDLSDRTQAAGDLPAAGSLPHA